MNIAHIIPHSITYPLKSHNGRYDWVLQLALLQAKVGHTVTIYGGPDSHIDGLHFAAIPSNSEDKRQNNIDTFRLAFAKDHDVYHSHFDSLHYEVASETTKPIVATQHWWPSEETVRIAHSFDAANVWAVPPTRDMLRYDAENGIQSKGFIYHGIDLNFFKEVEVERTDRLLFVGRISPEKNLELAITAAKKVHAKLDIIGKIAAKNDAYWQSLQLLIDGEQIRYIGTKNQTELVELYSSARGAILPFEPTEAFGLVAIEAQACGAPVIMKAGGSRSELVEENVTGFLCTTEDEFVAAINSLQTLDRTACRTFAQKFSIDTMVNAYDALYEEVTKNL